MVVVNINCKWYLELGLISTFISMTGKVLSKDNSKCRHNSIGYIGNKNMFFYVKNLLMRQIGSLTLLKSLNIR